MKYYPTITKDMVPDVHIYAFDKLDGSNIRAEWNSKKGFYKFGTRNQLMDENSKPFGAAIPLIKEKFEKDISDVCQKLGWRDALFFFEYYGLSSFAGFHNFEEAMTATLFDVNPYKKGLLEPVKFIEYFGHLNIPKILYQGEITVELVDQIKQSTLPNMTFEGCVCKGSYISPGVPLMFKIKSNAWLNKLRIYCKDNESLFEKLS